MEIKCEEKTKKNQKTKIFYCLKAVGRQYEIKGYISNSGVFVNTETQEVHYFNIKIM